MFNRQLVLVAIDHGTDVGRTMNVALRTAKAREADVHVIRVVPFGPVRLDDRPALSRLEPHSDERVNVEARLASILQGAEHNGVHAESVTLRGEPEHVIPAYAQLRQAAILVLERDYGSSRFWRTGSVVDELARQSSVPLLVLPRRRSREREDGRLRRVITAVDFSSASAVALRTAVDLSRRHGARLTLVHALKDVPRHTIFSGSEAWDLVRRLPAQLEAVADRLRRKAAFFGADHVETEVATGAADSAIVEIATRSDADLVVMGIAHRSWLDRLLFGSTLRRVLRRAVVPVLVVPVVAGAHTWPSEPVLEQRVSPVRTRSGIDRVAA